MTSFHWIVNIEVLHTEYIFVYVQLSEIPGSHLDQFNYPEELRASKQTKS